MNFNYTNTVYKNFFEAVPLDHSGAGFNFLKQSIKGRVERDCLNVSQNKTEDQSNTYSANALGWAPTSEDTCCMMRVQKETGIERGGRPENGGRPIKVMIKDSKIDTKIYLFTLFY